MKKKQIRKYLRRADDLLEEIEKRMRYIDATLFFVSLGLEYFYQQEDCQQVNMAQLIKEYINMLRTGDITELHKILDELRKV